MSELVAGKIRNALEFPRRNVMVVASNYVKKFILHSGEILFKPPSICTCVLLISKEILPLRSQVTELIRNAKRESGSFTLDVECAKGGRVYLVNNRTG